MYKRQRYACGNSQEGRRFTTAFLAEYSPTTRELTYVNAGHNAPILRRASGAVERLEAELQELSEKSKVYRSKGILWIEGTPRRAIFHGVNNRFTIFWDRLWEKDELRLSQLVFIGQDLDQLQIEEILRRCLA